MKYWFYSEGNILGPYEPAEMLALPAFAEESLVCPETATGDNPGDWRPASQVAAIASALGVGTGRSITAGVMAGAYEYETGFSSTVRYFEDKEPQPGASYGELLDTIDNILGAYKEGQETPAKYASGTGYDLAEKFDIKLARIQEELEAARWEKNLLLEKMRLQEMEEKKSRERIDELEARLKEKTGKSEVSVRETEQVRQLTELKEKADTIRKIEEIKREELSLKEDIALDLAAPAVEAAPEGGPARESKPIFEPKVKTLKSIPRGGEIKLEKAIENEGPQEADNSSITSRKFKSLGQTQKPAYVYSGHYDKSLPGPEAAPEGAFKPETSDPLTQQAGGMVYDFSVVTAKASETSQQFGINIRQDGPALQVPVQPVQPVQQPLPQPAQQFQPKAVQPDLAPGPQAVERSTYDFGIQPQAVIAPKVPSAGPDAFAAQPQAQKPGWNAPKIYSDADNAPLESPDKTQRIPLPQLKGRGEAEKGPEKPKKKGGKMAFITILVILGSIATGGLGYFFMGEGLSFSEFSMMNIGSKKKTSAVTSRTAAAFPAAVQPQPAVSEPAGPAEPQPAAPAAQKPVNGNISLSLDIVKRYSLSGGRGTIASWFANSFLSGASGGTSEEWTATPLHGDILAVQYRLTRPKQEPMVYQFEVDAAKRDIVRGLNNNAIELLDSSTREKIVSSARVKKTASKTRPAVKKTSRPKGLAMLPLPDAPEVNKGAEQAPTGFEQPETDDKVKYLKAQESDEELF